MVFVDPQTNSAECDNFRIAVPGGRAEAARCNGWKAINCTTWDEGCKQSLTYDIGQAARASSLKIRPFPDSSMDRTASESELA